MERAGGVRAVDRQDIHAGNHLVEAFPIGGVKISLQFRAQAFSVVVVDLHPERAGAPSHGLADAAHAQDAKAAATDPAAKVGHGGPALPFTCLHFSEALGDAAGDGEDQGKGHIGGIFGDHAGGVGDEDAALAGRCHINMVHPCPVISDEFQAIAGLCQHGRIYDVGESGDQNVAALHGGCELVAGHAGVGIAQVYVEQLFHAGFNRGRQASRDDHIQAG